MRIFGPLTEYRGKAKTVLARFSRFLFNIHFQSSWSGCDPSDIPPRAPHLPPPAFSPSCIFSRKCFLWFMIGNTSHHTKKIVQIWIVDYWSKHALIVSDYVTILKSLKLSFTWVVSQPSSFIRSQAALDP